MKKSFKNDPMVWFLLIMAAGYFILYYLTDPARPANILAPLGLKETRLYATGWFGFWDQSQYLRLAKTLASFNFSQLPTVYTYGLGYPLVAVPILWLGISSDPFLPFNFLVFLFTVFSVYYSAKKLISPFAAFVAGFGLVFATPLIKYTDQPWNSTVCLVAISVFLILLTVKKVKVWHAILVGGMLAWVFSARYIDVLFLGPLGIACMYRGNLKQIIKPLIYTSIIALILALPIFYSHYKVFGSPFRTPYVNHIGLNGVGGSDQGLQAYSIKRVPKSGLALFVSPILAGSKDIDRGLFIDYFWALAAIPGFVLLIKRKTNKLFFVTVLGMVAISTIFYLSFRASTPDSLKYGELHYFKVFWPVYAFAAAAFFNELFQRTVQIKKQK